MKKIFCGITALLIVLCLVLSASAEWLAMTVEGEITFVSAVDKLALREEPTTRSKELGTYSTGSSEITVYGRYWDEVNEIWWLQCSFEYGNGFAAGWTGAKRFAISQDELYDLPLYEYVPDDWEYPDWCSGESDYDPYDYAVYGLATMKLSLRSEPTTKSTDLGTYPMDGEWILLTGRHWDKTNSIWWLEVNFPYKDGYITGWTGLKRFDASTFDLYDLPEY